MQAWPRKVCRIDRIRQRGICDPTRSHPATGRYPAAEEVQPDAKSNDDDNTLLYVEPSGQHFVSLSDQFSRGCP